MSSHTINRRRVLTSAAGTLAASLSFPQRALAQSGPLRIVVGYPPGGASDRAARLVADRLQQQLRRTVIVENRVGAGGRLAAQQLVNTPADQTVLMIGNPAVMTVAPIIYKDLKYDPQKDFVPIAAVTDYEFGVAVGPGLPVRQVSHMMAWLRANPDKANAGVPAAGSLPHFFALMLGYMVLTKIEVVGYRGSAALVTDLIGGHVPMAFDTLDSLLPPHEGGRVRLLAVSGAKRSPFAPQVPTFKEEGLPLVASGWNYFFAPATTPKPMTELLSKTIAGIMAEPETRAKFVAAKMSPLSLNAQQTAAAWQAFNTQWAPIVRRSGFKGEA
jgi:tripartite-type tricarboxylate transporter receptor subunit TctC